MIRDILGDEILGDKMNDNGTDSKREPDTRDKILSLIPKYYEETFKKRFGRFIPGETPVPCSGKLFDEKELIYGVEAILDGWWTDGKYSEEFSRKLKGFLGVKHLALVNSGSSANLLAITSLKSHLLGEKRLKDGDEIITAACGFPTTVNPIIQSGCVPVFVDVEVGTYVPAPEMIEKAITPKTKAIFLAHTLGNPFNLIEVKRLCDKHGLYLIEDCCDALGSTYDDKNVGTFGDIATLSFYPAHHITAGEGGAIFTNNPLLFKIILSMRDWGRDCWCLTGKDNTCGKRFSQQHGELPFGYDHKYVYSHIGYNLKMTDMQAAIGSAQIDKLHSFIDERKKNFKELYSFFERYPDAFILPKHYKEADPSWFGFLLTIKEGSGIDRTDLLVYLDKHKIGTRLLFGGNLTKQPCFLEEDIDYRIVGNLDNTDIVMKNTFWIGVEPLITHDMLEYVKHTFEKYLNEVQHLSEVKK